MARKRSKRLPTQANDTLARLRRIYGQQAQLQYDKFGRRTALPSEIANQMKERNSSAGTPSTP